MRHGILSENTGNDFSFPTIMHHLCQVTEITLSIKQVKYIDKEWGSDQNYSRRSKPETYILDIYIFHRIKAWGENRARDCSEIHYNIY